VARALAVEAAAGGSRALTARTAGALEVLEMLEVRCWRRPVETSRAPGVAVEAREQLCRPHIYTHRTHTGLHWLSEEPMPAYSSEEISCVGVGMGLKAVHVAHLAGDRGGGVSVACSDEKLDRLNDGRRRAE